MANAKKKSFIMYLDMLPAIESLPVEDIGHLFVAIMHYADDGTMPEGLSPACNIAFMFVKGQLDRDNDKYERACEKKAEAMKRRHSVKNTIDIYSNLQNTIDICRVEGDNDNDNVNVNDISDNDNDNVSVSDNDNVCNSTEHTHNTHSEKIKFKNYGKYVKLSDEDYTHLILTYGDAIINQYITRMNMYIESKGLTPYSDSYPTLLKWLTEDDAKPIGDKPSYDLDAIMEHAKNAPLIP